MVNNHTVHPHPTQRDVTVDPHPTQRDVTVHMNGKMPIHKFNSNDSYTYIFYIIPTSCSHIKLACINHSHSSQIINAIHFKQQDASTYTWTNFSPTTNSGLHKVVPLQTVNFPMTAPSSSLRYHFLGTEVYGHFWPCNSKRNHFHGFLDRN